MTHYDVRLHTDKGVEISNNGIKCDRKGIPGMLACIVMNYLKDAPYPGAIKAHVIDDKRYTEYTLLLENNTLHVYLHVEKATQGGSAGTATAPRRFQGTPGQGGICRMTRYIVRLYSDKKVQIHGRRIECNRRDVPGRLVCIVRDYLKDAPYPGVIKAHVIAGRRYTEYILLLENNTLDVCRHVLEAGRAEVQKHPVEFTVPPGRDTAL